VRLIERVVQACNGHGKPVTVCGEMAGWPRCFLMLLGMGVRRLSMSPAFVPTIKEVARHTTLEVARDITRRALALHTAGAVRGFLTRTVREVWPNVTLVDTGM